LTILTGCLGKNTVNANLKNKNKTQPLDISVSNIQIVNHQIVVTGTNLNVVSGFAVKEGSSSTTLQIESQSSTSIIANTLADVSFAAGKLFEFILSNANAAATYTVNFSLCDSTLGGKGFDCTTPVNNDIISYDAVTHKWKPRAFSGLTYQGAWDSSDPLPSATTAGDYYIVSTTNAPYTVGDWIVSNGTTFDQINNSTSSVADRLTSYIQGAVLVNSFGTSAGETGELRFYELVANGASYTGFKSPDSLSGSLIYVLPTTAPTAGQVLSSDASRNLSWITPTSSPVTSVNTQTGAVVLTSTNITEGSNLYYTNARVLSSTLTGYSVGANTVLAATDTIKTAFALIQYLIYFPGCFFASTLLLVSYSEGVFCGFKQIFLLGDIITFLYM